MALPLAVLAVNPTYSVLCPEKYRKQNWKRDVKWDTVHFPHLSSSELSHYVLVLLFDYPQK